MDGISGVGGSKHHVHYDSPDGRGFKKQQKTALHEFSAKAFEWVEESGESAVRYISRRSSGLPNLTERKISKKELRYTAGRIADKAAAIFNA